MKWKLQRVYWFSVDDQAGACNFCDGSGLFGTRLQAEEVLVRIRQVRRRHPVRAARKIGGLTTERKSSREV